MTEQLESRPWARRHWVAIAVVLAVVLIGVWTAVESARSSDRQADGVTDCEDAVREQLLPGYDPQIAVTFEEKQPSGDLAYSAVADDGDGQWTCTIGKDGSVDVVNGLVYN